MDKITLEAHKRETHGKANALLRAAGKVPAVAYGHAAKPESLELDARLMERVYRQAGGNKMVSLKVGDAAPRNVLIHEVQHDGRTGSILHADFYVVRMDELLKTEVPLHFIGESTAVYQDEGTLVKNLEMLEVECLPNDIPESFVVDISVLDDFEKSITVADLVIPEGVKLLGEDIEDMLIVKVDPPRSDEEMAELDETIDEAAELPEGVQEEDPTVVSEENEGDKDRR